MSMQTRPLGRTGHSSSIAVLGAYALGQIDQDNADGVVQRALDTGVNHIDVSPVYFDAEIRLGPWSEELARRNVLLACKTGDRSAPGARAELERSLQRLRRSRFALYQLHAITDIAELDRSMDALQGLVDAQSEGLIEHIGITGHGHESPAAMLEALRRFDFATIMFPVNAFLWSLPSYRQSAEELLDLAADRDRGVLALKATAKQPKAGDTYHTWYEPFDTETEIAENIRFTLSQNVTAFCTAGDYRLLDHALNAASNFEPMSTEEMQSLIDSRAGMASIFG